MKAMTTKGDLTDQRKAIRPCRIEEGRNDSAEAGGLLRYAAPRCRGRLHGRPDEEGDRSSRAVRQRADSSLNDADDRAIEYYRAKGREKERFGHTMDRIGVETVLKEITLVERG